MLHLHHKHRRGGFLTSKSNELSFVRLFLALGLACVDTVWVIYMNSLGLSDSTIGFISSFLVVISFLASFFVASFLERFNQLKILIISFLFSIFGYLVITLFKDIYFFVSIAIILSIVAVFRVNAFDILFRDLNSNNTYNEKIGLLYSLLNIGWLVGPLVAGFILLEFGVPGVFIVASMFLSMALILLLLIRLEVHIKKRKIYDTHPVKNIIDFFRRKDLILSYIMSAGIYAWWSIIYIYMPLFIIESGISEGYIGLFFSLIVVPLVLIEYLVGKYSKKLGFRIFFRLGYFFLAICALLMFIFSDIYVRMAIAIFASFFAGFLEPLQDPFFFNKVKKTQEEKYCPIYLTAIDVGSFLGKFVIAIILLFLPAGFAFITMAVLMALFFLFALKVRKEDN